LRSGDELELIENCNDIPLANFQEEWQAGGIRGKQMRRAS
jgi:hypothetical protein